jgi:hypothetical protein
LILIDKVLADIKSTRWLDYIFERVGEIALRLGADGKPFEDIPHLRFNNVRNLPLHGLGAGPFCKLEKVVGLERVGGVYVITVLERPMYVGKTRDMVQRFGDRGYRAIQPANCFKGGQSTNLAVNGHLLENAKEGKVATLWFRRAEEPEQGLAESALKYSLQPPWNRAP